MKTLMGWRFYSALLALTVFNHQAFASGVVTAATESNLRAALLGGGAVSFDCDVDDDAVRAINP